MISVSTDFVMRYVMRNGFTIRPEAIYDDKALIIGARFTSSALDGARRAGRLRFARIGRRKVMRGSWLLEWLDREALADDAAHT